MKRTVFYAVALAFVLGTGLSFSAPSVVFAADKKPSACDGIKDKKEMHACKKCEKIKDEKKHAACMKKEMDKKK